MTCDIKRWRTLLAGMLSVLLVGCAGIRSTTSDFRTQSALSAESAARGQAQLTGPFAMHMVSPDSYPSVGANLSKEKGNRYTASGNRLIVLGDSPFGTLFNAFCLINEKVVSLEVKEAGKNFSFALSFNDGLVLNGKGTVGADGSVSGSYTSVGPCQGDGTFTAGKTGPPLAGTYTGNVTDFSSPGKGDTITISLHEAADGSLTVNGTSQLVGPFVMNGFVAGNLLFMEGTLNGSDIIPVYGIYHPATDTSPAGIGLVGPDGNEEGFIGNLYLE